MAKHAFLSASGAPAWLRCSIKPWREKGLPDEFSIFAAEGTKAHELLEYALKNKINLREDTKSVGNKAVEYVAETLDLIESLVKEDDVVYSEQKLDISFITNEPGATGTADVVIVGKDEITIVDLKYGMGVRVEAEENEQLLIYGAAAMKEHGKTKKKLRMIISQPRLEHVSEWSLTRTEVSKRIKEIRAKADGILNKVNLVATPGMKQCLFCKVKVDCNEYRDYITGVVTTDLVDLDKEDEMLKKISDAQLQITQIDDKHLATCMDALDLIALWSDSVRKEVARRLHNCTFTDKRYKLVEGRPGHRRYNDEAAAAAVLLTKLSFDEVYPRAIIPITAAEKLIDKETKENLKKHLIRPKGKISVVKQEDKREAINQLIISDLDSEEYVESLIGLSEDK